MLIIDRNQSREVYAIMNMQSSDGISYLCDSDSNMDVRCGAMLKLFTWGRLGMFIDIGPWRVGRDNAKPEGDARARWA